MSPTMRRLSGRSTRSSTSFPSSRIAIRVSRGAALMRISLFIFRRLAHRSATRRAKCETVPKKVRAVVLQGRVMIFLVSSHQRFTIHVSWTRESHGFLMHGKQQSVRTNLRSQLVFPQRRQQLTSCDRTKLPRVSQATYVTAHSDSRHGPVDEPADHQNV